MSARRPESARRTGNVHRTGVRLHDPLAFHGRVEMVAFESELLRDTPLGDPWRRELAVYTPPGGEERELPLVFVLAGFTGRGQSYLETHPWRSGVVQLFDRAVERGETPPAILALPDCFTRLGGSQYVDSTAVGPYASHVVDELVPLAEEGRRVLPGRRGVVGKSSGGFGALHLAMRHPGHFPAVASISGDCGFDALFPGEFLACLRGLVPHDMDPARFLADFEKSHELSGDGHAVINVLAMAACYSPNPGSPLGFDLPFDLATGELVESVWRRWLAFDPLVAVDEHADALRALELLHVECGLADEFHLQWGLRRLQAKLERLDVPHDHFEHPGGHRGIDHRYADVLAKLAAHLSR